MKLDRRQLLGAAVGTVAAGLLPVAASEPVKKFALYSVRTLRREGEAAWNWTVRYALNGGQIETHRHVTDKCELNLPGELVLSYNTAVAENEPCCAQLMPLMPVETGLNVDQFELFNTPFPFWTYAGPSTPARELPVLVWEADARDFQT